MQMKLFEKARKQKKNANNKPSHQQTNRKRTQSFKSQYKRQQMNAQNGQTE
jgi:hypothetical protein